MWKGTISIASSIHLRPSSVSLDEITDQVKSVSSRGVLSGLAFEPKAGGKLAVMS
jgi:hypothetical protein